jgi:hypothetical protein
MLTSLETLYCTPEPTAGNKGNVLKKIKYKLGTSYPLRNMASRIRDDITINVAVIIFPANHLP